MSFITTSAVNHLLAHGYYVRAPGDPPEPINPAEARRVLAAHGFRVFLPASPPDVDSVWAPSPRHDDPLHARVVTGVDCGQVSYRVQFGNEWTEHRIWLVSWHNWRRRVKARRVM
jgi:hypothetical protein